MKRLVVFAVIMLFTMLILGGCLGQSEEQESEQEHSYSEANQDKANQDEVNQDEANQYEANQNESNESNESNEDYDKPVVVTFDNNQDNDDPRNNANQLGETGEQRELGEVLTKDPLFLLINKSREDIELIFGVPDEIDYWSGAEYYYYDREKLVLYFGTNARYDDGNHVTSVQVLEGQSLVGVNVGENIDEILQILGRPSSYGYNEMDMSYNINYLIEEHTLTFSAEKENGPTYEGQIFGYNQ